MSESETLALLAAIAIGFAGGWGWSRLLYLRREHAQASVNAAIIASLSRDPRALIGTIRVGNGPTRRVPSAIVCDNTSIWRD